MHCRRYLLAHCLFPRTRGGLQYAMCKCGRLPHHVADAEKPEHRWQQLSRKIAYDICPPPCHADRDFECIELDVRGGTDPRRQPCATAVAKWPGVEVRFKVRKGARHDIARHSEH